MAAVDKSHTPLKLHWFNNCLGDEFSDCKQKTWHVNFKVDTILILAWLQTLTLVSIYNKAHMTLYVDSAF